MGKFDNYKFRCSSLGKLMTDPKSKKDKEEGNLSETTKSYLLEIFIKEVYGRKKDITNRYLEKGLLMEEDALELIGNVHNTIYIKNKETFSNDLIKGTPDYCKKKLIDTKSSWDIFTFFKVVVSKEYYWQLQGYMWLTGHEESILAYCLVDTPEHQIYKEQNSLAYNLGVIDRDNDKHYLEACAEIEKLSIYSDIPDKERVREFPVKRNEEDLERLKERIPKWREYLNSLLSYEY